MPNRRSAFRLAAAALVGAHGADAGLAARTERRDAARHSCGRRRRRRDGAAPRCEPCAESLRCIDGRLTCVAATQPQCGRCEKLVCADDRYACVADPTSPCTDEAPNDALTGETV